MTSHDETNSRQGYAGNANSSAKIIKIKRVDISDNSGDTTGFSNFFNTLNGADSGSCEIEAENINMKGNKGNLKGFTDFANTGDVGKTGRQVLTTSGEKKKKKAAKLKNLRQGSNGNLSSRMHPCN
ncbi:hypothetical protein L3X38_002172 [Prunus dulcis]|uniref:Uncharacterized protein n=1 Tax=Prunus dulcis TaxID=3755 RepID=A0AAD4ZKI4_PRUDU|nr:hypothetical protein L3X38_002172 [Prunus dulcis]